MNFAFKMMKSVLEMMNFVFKMMKSTKAGLDILYLRQGPACRDSRQTTAIDCPDTAQTSQQSNETHEALGE